MLSLQATKMFKIKSLCSTSNLGPRDLLHLKYDFFILGFNRIAEKKKMDNLKINTKTILLTVLIGMN